MTDGCNCQLDPDDKGAVKNDTCAKATDKGDLLDVGTKSLIIQGTLSSDADEDWYTIQAKDQAEAVGKNTYRVHIEFDATGNPGDEFRFDVIRGDPVDPCAISGAKTLLTSYDWCADNIKNPAEPPQDDQSAPYRVRVYRTPGFTAFTCKTYSLKLTNGGSSAACPAPDACGS